MSRSFRARPASAEELPHALALLFQNLSSDEREAQVARVLNFVATEELKPAGILVACAQSTLVGALICQPAPGATGLIWPPQTEAGVARVAVEDCLVQGATSWLRQCGARIGQALLAVGDLPFADSLERNGFAHITSLDYLNHDFHRIDETLRSMNEGGATGCATPLEMQSYTTADKTKFHNVLLQTYQGTLDCPEVNDVRDIDDIIEGHRAQGKHDPGRWWLASEGTKPVGVLLLTELPENRAWDLSYVGVLPEARGRGIGQQLVSKALYEAWTSSASQLTLSVDARNTPACKLYRKLGFHRFDKRECFLAIW